MTEGLWFSGLHRICTWCHLLLWSWLCWTELDLSIAGSLGHPSYPNRWPSRSKLWHSITWETFRRLHFISSIAFPFLHEFESLNSKCHEMLPNHSGDATSWSFLDIFPALNSGRQLVYQGTVTQRLIVSILYVKIITGNIVSFFPGFARLHLKTLQQTSTRSYPHELMTPSHNKMQQIHTNT